MRTLAHITEVVKIRLQESVRFDVQRNRYRHQIVKGGIPKVMAGSRLDTKRFGIICHNSKRNALYRADRLEADLPAESLFVSYKEFNDPDSPIFHTPEVQRVHKTFETVSHFGAIAGLNLTGYGTFIVVGYPRIQHEDVRQRTMHMYHIDIGDYEEATEEREQPVENVQGVESEFGIFYKDKRAQRAHDSFALAELQQAAGRSRPAIWPDTVTVIYSAALIEISENADFYTKRDFSHATSFSEIRYAVKSREADIIKAEGMARMGASIRGIATECNISVWQAREIISEVGKEKTLPKSARTPKRSYIYINDRAPVDTPENMPVQTTSPLESMDSTLESMDSTLESPHSKNVKVNSTGKYHKDVMPLVLDFLSDGMEKRTREILDAIDANPVTVKQTLAKMLKKGLIEKVRHGVYRIGEVTAVKTESVIDASKDDSMFSTAPKEQTDTVQSHQQTTACSRQRSRPPPWLFPVVCGCRCRQTPASPSCVCVRFAAEEVCVFVLLFIWTSPSQMGYTDVSEALL